MKKRRETERPAREFTGFDEIKITQKQLDALRRKRDHLNLEIGKLSREIKRLQRSGIEKRKADRARIYAERRAAIYQARKSGETFSAIGRQFGICANRVRQVVHRMEHPWYQARTD